MKQNFVKVFSLILVLTIGMLGCGSNAPRQAKTESRLEKMKPKTGDSLSKLMDRSWSNFDYVIYGFLNYDTEKIKIASDNLVTLGEHMSREIPAAYQSHRTEWNEQCNRMRELSINLKREFENQDFLKAREHFLALIETCMDCHKVYRKHLIKSPE